MGIDGGALMASMNDFLLQYYMQRRFNNMPPEVRAKFDDYLKAEDGKGGHGDFSGNMKDWRKKLMHEQPAGSGKYENNTLPDPTQQLSGDDLARQGGKQWDLSQEDWEKLYNAFRDAFRSMSAKKKSFEDNDDATKFFNKYFGNSHTHMFSLAMASDDAKREISKLLAVLETDTSIGLLLKDELGDISFDDFKKAIREGKYNKEPKWQNALKKVAGALKYLQIYEPDKFIAFTNAGIDLDKIEQAFDEAHPNPRQLQTFKDSYDVLLNAITKKKINDVFKDHDGGKITGKIDEAKSKVDYDNKDSKDYVPPKRDDELTPLQQMRRWAGDTYKDVLGKYLSAHGNRVYFSDAARKIVEAIDKAKIKPTDGLDKVLSSEGDIKKEILYKSPTAATHFEWFVKTMNELKTTMPKAFAGALKNGRQLRAIVSEMIMKAVREGKIPEAKTAMEVLSVIKYGYTTSKIMDTLRKEEFKVFSDGGLSWNKNQGMQFVTNALDKSIKAAFIGVGYGVTMVGNAYRLNGSKFNGKKGRLKKTQENWAAQNSADKQAASDLRDINNNADMAERATHQAELNRLNSGRNPINDSTLSTVEANIARDEQRIATRRQNIDRAKQRPAYIAAEQKVATVDNLDAELTRLETDTTKLRQEAHKLRAEVSALDAKLNDPATYAGMPAPAATALAQQLTSEKQAKQAELTAKSDERRTKLQDMRAKMTDYRAQTGQSWRSGLAGAHGAAYTNAKNTLDNMARRESRYESLVQRTNDTKDNVAKFKEARDTVRELDQAIQKRDEEIEKWDDNHKDKYKELMAYWDMLETGRDSHTGKMYKWDLLRSNKHTQKKFDATKANIIQNFNSGYTYAA